MINEYTLVNNEYLAPKLKAIKQITLECETDTTEEFAMLIFKEVYNMDILESEHAFLASINGRDEINGIYHVSIGDYNGCSMYNRTIATVLILAGAKEFLVVHNHPQAQLEPSVIDKANNACLSTLGKLIGINFLGSYIINDDGYHNIETGETVYWWGD